MHRQSDQDFIRQKVVSLNKVAIGIPPNASKSPQFRTFVRETTGLTELPPTNFIPYYLDYPVHERQLDDRAMITTSTHGFLVRDAVVRVFDLLGWWNDEFCWSFSTTSQVTVLAAVKIGETIDVCFDQEFEQVFYVNMVNISSTVPNSGFGTYAVHVAIEHLSPQGFRVISSYEPHSHRTPSRLPFLFSFRVFGRMSGDPEFPVWRDLLAEATRQALMRQWHHALLYAAFSLESFIDRMLADKLTPTGVGEDYINHILRVGEKRFELLALNSNRLSRSAVNKLSDELNANIFSPRNKLAHGKMVGRDVTKEIAVQAVRTAVEFIWDWSREARPWLLDRVHYDTKPLLDEDLLRACHSDS